MANKQHWLKIKKGILPLVSTSQVAQCVYQWMFDLDRYLAVDIGEKVQDIAGKIVFEVLTGDQNFGGPGIFLFWFVEVVPQ